VTSLSFSQQLADVMRRRPLTSYFVLAFGISWGLMLAVLVAGGGAIVPSESDMEDLLPFVVLAVVAGPSAAGLICCWVVDGRDGLRELRARLFRWRVSWRWYALAFLGLPLIAAAGMIALRPFSDASMPGIVDADDRASLIVGGIAAGLAAGIFEEVGWTGFATPRLRKRYGVVVGGLILGFLWGAWHYITALSGSGTESGGFSTSLFLAMMLFYVAVLPAVRVLMVWVHDRTHSLLVLIVMHCSLTGNVLFILMPDDPTSATLGAWYGTIAALAWALVLLLAVRTRRQAPAALHPAGVSPRGTATPAT